MKTINEHLQSYIALIEDDPDLAESFENELEMSKVVDNIDTIIEVNDLLDFLRLNNESQAAVRVCIVDVHLGTGLPKQGIEVIKEVRKKSKDALIIVHTAYADTKDICMSVGANYFFVKSPGKTEKYFKEIDKIIENYLFEKMKLVTYCAEISHINKEEELVKLDCYYDDEIIEKHFPIGPIEKALNDDLIVDKVVRVCIFEEGNEIKIRFVESNTVLQDEDEDDDMDISNDEFMNSAIWTNKLK